MSPSGMKVNSLLIQIRRRAFASWRALPIFGPLLDDFRLGMVQQRVNIAQLRSARIWASCAFSRARFASAASSIWAICASLKGPGATSIVPASPG